MKLLLIGRAVATPDRIANYSDMQSFYLAKALQRQRVQVEFLDLTFETEEAYVGAVLDRIGASRADHVVALGVRYFTRLPRQVGERIACAFDGLICQIHDGSLLDEFPCDVNFTVRDDAWRYADNDNQRLVRHHSRNWHVGWAADPVLFYPDKSANALRIFVDHTTFSADSQDWSLNIMMGLRKLRDSYFAKGLNFLGFETLEVRTQTDLGLVDVDLDNIQIRPYHRTAVPVPIFARELREAHIFLVTHAESVGLCVLEAAMSGAFVMAPKGAINPDRLKTVRHVEFGRRVDWTVLDHEALSVKLNTQYCRNQSWDNVATRMVEGLIAMGPLLQGKRHFRRS